MDRVWLIQATCLAVFGLGMIAWGRYRVVAMRSHPDRRRCPKCRFDMSRTDGRRCPECGHVARHEYQCFRPRLRRVPAILGTVILLAAPTVARIGEARDHGLIGLVPTTVLAALMPVYESRADWRLRDPLVGEMLRRAEAGEPTAWQWRLLYRHATWRQGERLDPSRPGRLGAASAYAALLGIAEGRGTLPESVREIAEARSRLVFEHRRSWPVGVPIAIDLEPMEWIKGDADWSVSPRYALDSEPIRGTHVHDPFARSFSVLFHPFRDFLHTIPAARVESEGLPIQVELISLATGAEGHAYETTLPVRIHGTVADHIESVRDARVGEALGAAPLARFEFNGRRWIGYPYSGFDRVDAAARDAGIDVIALQLELVASGRTIARGELWRPVRAGEADRFDEPFLTTGNVVALEPLPGMHGLFGRDDLSLRISGHPSLALRDPDARTAWAGAVVRPLYPRDASVRDRPSRTSGIRTTTYLIPTAGDVTPTTFGSPRLRADSR